LRRCPPAGHHRGRRGCQTAPHPAPAHRRPFRPTAAAREGFLGTLHSEG
jgi:hypothetical protein